MKITYIPTSKAKELLTDASKERELGKLQSAALKHAVKYSKLSAAKAQKLEEEIISLGIEEMVAVKIVDILPSNLDELRSVVYPHIQTLDQEIGNKILEFIGKIR
jgi:DNA-directed RNA polymerase subunit F